MSSSDPRVLMWVPLPPPVAGPEVASAMLADACRRLLPGAMVESASIRTSNMAKGRLDWSGIRAFSRAYGRFVRHARDADTVYLVAAANVVGCMRDAVLVATARALGKDVVLHMRGGRYGDFYRDSPRAMQWLLRRSWGTARTAIVQTERLRDVLAAAAPHVETVVVPNGLDADQFPAKQSYETARPRLLFVGHLTFSKGFHDLMRAFRELRKRHPDVTLVCAGERPTPEKSFADFLPSTLRDDYLARRHEICREIEAFLDHGEGVEYAGVVSGDTKRRLFESADVFVLPSYAEGFSMALLEAMFHGLPAVVARSGGLVDVVREGENGLLVDAGDVAQLTAALEQLVTSTARRELLGRTNAREARERYALEDVARKLTRVLLGLTPDRETGAPTARG